jgi:cytochrome c biogenesis protein CcmG/thiol:disulfide interchange protein DsbE
MIKKHFWIGAAVFTLLVIAGLTACGQRMSGAPSGLAPDFTLKDLDGKPFSFSSTRGKVVILDFWATWCPPCTAEIPHFVELYKEYRERGLEIVGVALDRGGASTVKPFAERNGMNYTVVIGDQRITADYGGIRGIPTTFVVDRQGRIAQKFVGYREKEVFEEAIKSLL